MTTASAHRPHTTFWQPPPLVKVYEALSAVADGRVAVSLETSSAEVRSSDGTRLYSVSWTHDFRAFGSNDNGSYWRGYLGYPILAAMMSLGRLRYSKPVACLLAGVQWNRINTAHKRDYDKAIDCVLGSLTTEEADAVRTEVARIVAEIRPRKVLKLPSGPPPDVKP